MQIVDTIEEWQRIQKQIQEYTIGLVPTMGNLHAGHASLLTRSKKENDLTVLSIFVNPAQFNDKADLNQYPKTLESDLETAKSIGVDYVFLPNEDMMYPDGYRYKVTEQEFSRLMEGAHRPGHFDGVLTVVLKLFNLIAPHKAYFGEKDRQQLLLIKEMVSALFLKVEIISCPTIRDENGLALSSRNQFLSLDNKVLAAKLAEVLNLKASCNQIISKLSDYGFEVDYVQDYGQYRFGAVKIQSVRLIDNINLLESKES